MLGRRDPFVGVLLPLAVVALLARVSVRRGGESVGLESSDAVILQQDTLFCDSLGTVESLFCRQDLPPARRRARQAAMDARTGCANDWESRGAAGSVRGLQDKHQASGATKYGPDDAPWASGPTPQGSIADAFIGWYAEELKDAPMNMNDNYKATPPTASLKHCSVTNSNADGGQRGWTFERMGPFIAEGDNWEWFSAGWPDAGRFAARLALSEVWVTTFGFSPLYEDGSIMGWPPAHIHHMHVTSSQTMMTTWVGGRIPLFNFNSLGKISIEFDIHGDRQCREGLGGTDCLIRSFPSGYGIQLSDAMETFYDLNIERNKRDPKIFVYTEHVWEWQTKPTSRPVGRFTTLIPSNIPFMVNFSYMGPASGDAKANNNFFDDYLLVYPPGVTTEYVAWSEQTFPETGSMVHLFWHTHYEYTQDMWAISASAEQLGLKQKPFYTSEWQTHAPGLPTYTMINDPKPEYFILDEELTTATSGCPDCKFDVVNVSAGGHTVLTTMEYIQTNLREAQEDCLTTSCAVEPRVRCTVHPDHWDVNPDAHFRGPKKYDRYHAPRCSRWDFTKGDRFTIVSFHAAPVPVQELTMHWQHTVMYGYWVATKPGDSTPHATLGTLLPECPPGTKQCPQLP